MDFEKLMTLIEARRSVVGIVGLGYVGVPMALAMYDAGFNVVGFDISAKRVADINSGKHVISYLEPNRIADAVASGRFEATVDLSRFAQVDAILICVPTPLTHHKEPDLTFIRNTSQAIARCLRPGQLVVLESTTWPGTSKEVVRPILEGAGHKCGEEFFLAYSPEREDPGNTGFNTKTIPKVVGADDDLSARLAVALYEKVLTQTVVVRGTATAEAVKLTENIFRAVNIALANELKIIYGAMGIDMWDVVEAAATKPFGFMPFYPGPGLGGHCVPIDPFYLTWKAREIGIETRFIELAGVINSRMPRIVVDRMVKALARIRQEGISGARVLVIGLAYKRNINDIRESPSLVLMELIEERGAECNYHDPYVGVIPPTRDHPKLAGRRSIELTREAIKNYDAILVATDHDAVDYKMIFENTQLVVDTQNIFARMGLTGDHIVKA